MHSSTPRQLIRYGIVGILSNLGGYLIYLIVTWMGVGPKTAMSILYTAGATIGFMGNRKWSFAYQGQLLPNFLRYASAHICGYAINFLILFVFVDELRYPHQIVQAIAIFIVAGFLFIIFKYFVFPSTTIKSRIHHL